MRKPAGNINMAEVALRAVEQHEEKLKRTFPNIRHVSNAVHDLNRKKSHVVAIYLTDNNTSYIPEKLKVEMPDLSFATIATEIVKGAGKGTIQLSQQETEASDSVNPDYSGSICCAVRSTEDPDFMGLVTSAHILTQGYYDESNNDIPNPPIASTAFVDGNAAGTWYYKLLSYNQDLAVIKLDEKQALSGSYKSFSDQYYAVSDMDVKTSQPNVTIISKGNRIRDAYILDYGVGTDVEYKAGPVYKKNIILIGSTNDRTTATPVSQPGDSGSCVFKKNTGQLIGILLGSDEMFTFVLPVNKTLQSQNLKTV
ncbi:MAG: hypothetical protein WCK09_13555 [Bacteroidota bacterium]